MEDTVRGVEGATWGVEGGAGTLWQRWQAAGRNVTFYGPPMSPMPYDPEHLQKGKSRLNLIEHSECTRQLSSEDTPQ